MKTPREILLNRHASASEKLDAIREEAVRAAGGNRRSTPGHEWQFAGMLLHSLATPIRELIWPARRIWAGLAAVWMVLTIFNLSQTDRGAAVAAKSTVPAAEIRLAFQEQQRLLAEILGPPPAAAPAEPPRRNIPQPRSQRRDGLAMA